jgi:hypothetical protein
MRRIEMLCKHLIESVEKNDIESVRTLTEELKEDVNRVIPYKNKPERDALTHAAHHGNITIAKHIVNNYGNVNVFYNNDRWNAVTEAIAHRNEQMVNLFLSKATLTTKQKALDYAREEEKPDERMISLIAESLAKDIAPIFDFIREFTVLGDVASDSIDE